jgi:hypothetical protein
VGGSDRAPGGRGGWLTYTFERANRARKQKPDTGVDVVTQSLGVSAGPEIIFKPTRFFVNSDVRSLVPLRPV